MFFFKPFYLFGIILSLSFFTQAGQSTQNLEDSSNIQNQMNQILKKTSIPLKHFGISVSKVLKNSYFSSTDWVDVSQNDQKLFIPASLIKIVTASSVFHYFKPSHQFETSFRSEGLVQEGRLQGSLCMKGGGDPSFVSESLWNLVNELKRSSFQKIEGDLILDDSLFKSKKSRWKRDLDRSFNAPLSALSFNWNSVNIFIRPGKLRQSAKVWIDPQNSYVQLKNKTRTQNSTKNIQVRRLRSSSKNEIFLIQGNVSPQKSEQVIYRNISDPIQWVGENVREFLKQRGLHLQGNFQRGKCSKDSKIFATHKGRSVFRLVRNMMKYSNNFIADVLTAHLAIQNGSSQGSVKEGVKAIRKYLKTQGIEDYQLVQPSGLSRKNKIKPRDLLKILVKDFYSMYSFEKISAYPLAGQDGTLKNRFKNLKNSKNFIRGKTGQLAGVIGLGGYVRNTKGKIRAFVFLYNGNVQKQSQVQRAFDEMADVLMMHH